MAKPKQLMPRGCWAAGNWGVPESTPHPATATGGSGRRKLWRARLQRSPGAPPASSSAPSGWNKGEGAHGIAPRGPFPHLAKAERTRTGVPKVTRTRYPPSWSAKPSRAAHADLGSSGHRGLQPAGRRGLQGEGGSPEVTQRVPQGEEHPSARLQGRAPRRTWQGPVHGVAHRCFRARRWRRRARGSPGLITPWAGDPGRGRAAGHRCCTAEPAGGSWGGSR